MCRSLSRFAALLRAVFLLFPALTPAQTRITMDSGYHANPTWSPDGNLIANGSDHSGNPDIWMIPAGGGVHHFTTDGADDGTGVWSPDGKTMAFHSDRTGDYHIWVGQTTVPVEHKTWGSCKSLFR